MFLYQNTCTQTIYVHVHVHVCVYLQHTSKFSAKPAYPEITIRISCCTFCSCIHVQCTSISGICFGSDFPVSGSGSGSAGDVGRLVGKIVRKREFHMVQLHVHVHVYLLQLISLLLPPSLPLSLTLFLPPSLLTLTWIGRAELVPSLPSLPVPSSVHCSLLAPRAPPAFHSSVAFATE